MFALLLLTLLQLPINTYNCTNLFAFTHSTCDFYFNNATDCQTFDFQYCTWQRCTLQYQREKNQCQQYQLVNQTNWQSCTAACCHSNVSYARNWDAVYECQASIDQSYYGTTVLSGVLLGVVILMVVLATCCFCYCCHTGCVECCCRVVKDCFRSLICCQCLHTGRQVHSVDHNVSQEGISGQNQLSQAVNNKSEWKYIAAGQFKQNIQQIVCCICLQDHTGLQLQCGHLLHSQCVRECVRLKPQCPLCRSKRINRVRIYCSGCYRAYLCCSLRWLLSDKVDSPLLCQKCNNLGKQGKG